MGHSFKSIDRLAGQLADLVIRRPWAIVMAAVAVAAVIATGVQHLAFASNYRVFFSDENPELTAFEDLQATYTKNDNFMFVLEPAGGDAFAPDTLAAVESLTAAAWTIPYAIRVDSLSNFQHTYGADDDLVVEDLFSGSSAMSPEELERRARIALDEPLLRRQLVTADGRVTAVNVVLQYPERSIAEVPEAVAIARSLRDRIEAEHPDIDVSLTGVSMLNHAFAETGISDLGTLVPIMFGVIGVLAVAVLRSVAATGATIAVIMLSTMVAMGAAGFAGIKLDPISGSAPIIILTLAIADSIHVLMSLRTAMREGMSKERALAESLRLNVLPVTITSLTTVVGFLALNFSDSPPFWYLGNITAVGIFAAWIYSLTLLPALIRLARYRVKPSMRPAVGERVMGYVAGVVIANPMRMVVSLAIATALLISLIPRTQLNDQWTKYFDTRVEFRRDTDKALEHFGMYPIEYSVPARGTGGVSDPEYLEHLERFAAYLESHPDVTHVYSLSDIMKRLNKNLHGDEEAYFRTPGDRDLAAQYLLLYELSLPYGLDLNDRISVDKSSTRVTATLGDVDSVQTKAFLDETQAWMERNLPGWMQAKPTGAQVMFTYIAQRNVENMVAGTVFAIAAIAVILMLALRSFRLGALSLVPNGLPILATFGAWALLVGEVGFSVATVASISLGIIVDDTVHLLTKYVRARTDQARSPADAIRYAFSSVGVALIVNTIILTAGFLVLVTSSFKVNIDMGLLTAIAIVFALVLDFLLLPAILLLIDGAGTPHPTTRGITMNRPTTRPVTGVAGSFVMAGVITLMIAGSAHAGDGITPARGATDADRRGFEVAARSDRSDRGFKTSEVGLEMILRNAAGAESRRTLTIATLEIPDEGTGDKSLVVFDNPRDIKGTALLSHAQILDPDDQWLYLPALKRVKRISSANKSGPFVGSEFAFEDFTTLELNKYDYTWLRSEELGGMTTDVIERTPRYENSGYTRQLSWIDRDVHQVRKVEFYDRRGDLLKTLVLGDYREYGAGIWRSHHFAMQNHQTGKSTELVYGDYEFDTGLGERDFVKGRLTRLR